MPYTLHSERLGLDTASPRTNPVVLKPNVAPAHPVASRWLDQAPPKVTRCVFPALCADWSMYLSLRHLLPEMKGCIRSSRLMSTLTDLSSNNAKSSVSIGLWISNGITRQPHLKLVVIAKLCWVVRVEAIFDENRLLRSTALSLFACSQ